MIRPRIIPTLLLRDRGLVKGCSFKNYRYLGDPINAVRIFSEKKVDELLFLDITATQRGSATPIELVRQIADECYMPFGVGGGIFSAMTAGEIIQAGAEKICLNTSALLRPELILECSQMYGSQSVLVSMDVKINDKGEYHVYSHGGKKRTPWDPLRWAQRAEEMGAGELMVTNIDKEGTANGYDLEILGKIRDILSIPLIASGGAGAMRDFSLAASQGATAVAAGSLFVFHGRRKAVLITYPDREAIRNIFPE